MVVAQPMGFMRAYFRETPGLVFDAHDKAFAFFGGVCRRGIYDNMKTAVEAIFVGKARQHNRRFLQMCSHHLIEPVVCTPASGWKKGQRLPRPDLPQDMVRPGLTEGDLS
jgi:transposase